MKLSVALTTVSWMETFAPKSYERIETSIEWSRIIINGSLIH